MATPKSYQIKQIHAKDTYAVRHAILRTGKPLHTCTFSDDTLSSTIHLALFYKTNIIGVASFMKTTNKLFPQVLQYQLRGMAVLKAYQGCGFGKNLLTHGEQILKNKGIHLIWCNARTAAVNFYKNNGYNSIGTPFKIPEIGEHYIMYKSLL